MAIYLPSNFGSWSVSHVPRTAPVGGSDKKTGNCIDAVFHTFAPLQEPVERQRVLTYAINGKQYVAVESGKVSGFFGGQGPASFTVFALP